MGRVIRIGRPCHFRPKQENVSACGVVTPPYSAWDARDCDCLRCMKTKAYKTYMGLEKGKDL